MFMMIRAAMEAVSFAAAWAGIERPVGYFQFLQNEFLQIGIGLPAPVRCASKIVQAMELMTDSGTARTISAGSDPKYSRVSVPNETDPSRL
jgi:hypothetical protein